MKNITIAGNCTKNAETRRTQSGNSVTSWAIAVNGFTNGEKTSMFFDVQFWGKRGEQAAQFAVKGAKMAVAGDLSTREYNGKTYLQINGSDFTPLGGGKHNDMPPGYEGSAPADADKQRGGGPSFDDEIPFSKECRA